MFRHAHEYTHEEMLCSCQDFFGTVYWAWYEVAVERCGEEKANAMLIELSKKFAAMEAQAMQDMWGKPFENLRQIADTLDIIHRAAAYEGSTRGSAPEWTMENDNAGYERIYHCPIHATTPAHLKDKGPTALCTVYCNDVGPRFYGHIGCTIEQDSWLTKGEPYCGFKIARKPELVKLSVK